MFHLSLALFVLFAGLLLMAWDAGRAEKKPLRILAGMVLFTVGITLRMLDAHGVAAMMMGLFVDAGIGLLGVSAFLAIRKRGGAPFVVLGLMSLAMGLLVYLVTLAFGGALQRHDEARSILVELGPDDTIEEVEDVLDRYHAHYQRAFPTVSLSEDEDLAQYYEVWAPPKWLKELLRELLKDDEDVDQAAYNTLVRLPRLPVQEQQPVTSSTTHFADDPLLDEQWGMAAIHGDAAHSVLENVTPARKAVVAILDTGVDRRHEDLRAVFRRSPGNTDQHGHGTHCAGIVGAATNNGVGVASLNWEGRFVDVVSYRALPHNGMGTLEDIAQAIIDAAEGGADVISMSLGDRASVPPKVVVDAVEYAERKGVIVVTSAGNNASDAKDHMPSNVDGVIVVAAVDQQLHRASFSNSNTSLAMPIAAPGVDILSLKTGGDYVAMSGTSMATPMVAGLLGVMRAINPELTSQQAYDILTRTGTTVDDSDQVGRVIDAEAAIRALLSDRAVADARSQTRRADWLLD